MQSSIRRMLTVMLCAAGLALAARPVAAQGVPTITTFKPKTCSMGADVKIVGSNFVNVTGVKIAGFSVPFTVNSKTLITAKSPSFDPPELLSHIGPVEVLIPGNKAVSTEMFQTYQQTEDLALMINVNCRTNPVPTLELYWPADSNVLTYTISRKDPGSNSFTQLTTFDATAQSQTITDYFRFSDTSIEIGKAYEYLVAGASNVGYVRSGINVPLNENRGKLILLTDSTYVLELDSELQRFERDLIGDGWQVIRHNVSRTATPPQIKAIIKADYDNDPANTKALILFGHVPVPYSGDIAPDGHRLSNDQSHTGAWPADMYYADMDGVWTDNYITDITSFDTRNHNIPGDGKFDQSGTPTPLELMFGRIDLANMTLASKSEMELLRQYLNKDHNWRNKYTTVQNRAIIDDNIEIEVRPEAFAQGGWRNFAPIVGTPNIVADNIWNKTIEGSYLMAKTVGFGSYTTSDGVGNSSQFYNNDSKVIFFLMIGSYFPDWDVANNFLRSPLVGANYTLTTGWSGRPHFQIWHMGLGEPIGHSVLATQNEYGGGSVHVELMGDPTLRAQQLAPVTNVAVKVNASGTQITWSASPDAGLPGFRGYNIYRGSAAGGPYTRLNASPRTSTNYTDTTIKLGSYQYASYMVRAIKQEITPSGTFYNGSTGIIQDNTAQPTVSISKPASGQFINGLSSITGKADDGFKTGAIARVELRLKRNKDGAYWNGFTWGVPANSSPVTIPYLTATYDPFARTWARQANMPNGTNLISGPYTLTATVIDTRNGTGSTTIGFTSDLIAPTVTFTAPITAPPVTAYATVTNLSSFAGTIVDNKNQTAGVGPGRVTLSIRRNSDSWYWNGTAWAAPVVAIDTTLNGTNWSINSNLPTGSNLLPGSYVVTARGYDRLNNNYSLAVTLYVDNAAPVMTFTKPVDGTFVNNLNPIQGNVSDNTGGSGVLRVDLVVSRPNISTGQTEYWSGSRWLATPTVLPTILQVFSSSATTVFTRTDGNMNTAFLTAGVYTIVATAYDRSNNTSTKTAMVTVDVSPPTVVINNPVDGGSVTSITTISGTATENAGGSGNAYVQVMLRRASDNWYWTGSAWGPNPQQLPTTLQSNGNWSKTGGFPSGAYLTPGGYVAVAIAFDVAGNSRTTQNAFSVVAGSGAPPANPPAPDGGTSTGGGTATPSSVKYSSAASSAANRQVWLYFNGALDASSVTPIGNYKVLVNGQTATIGSAAYGSVSRAVLLTLDTSFTAGDKLDITWTGLKDSAGLTVSGQVGPLTAR